MLVGIQDQRSAISPSVCPKRYRVMAKSARAPQPWSFWMHLPLYLLEIPKGRWKPALHPIPVRGLHSDLAGVASRCRRPAAIASLD